MINRLCFKNIILKEYIFIICHLLIHNNWGLRIRNKVLAIWFVTENVKPISLIFFKCIQNKYGYKIKHIDSILI